MFKLFIETGGEIVELTHNRSQYTVTEISGLMPPQQTINLSQEGLADGAAFNSAHVETRNIVITVVMEGDIAASRQRLYRLFPYKKSVIVHFQGQNRHVYISGWVELISGDLFSRRETEQISIICPKPYWIGMQQIQADISTVLAGFSFPFAIPSEGVILSGTMQTPGAVVNNPGDAVTGFQAEIRVADVEPEITVTSELTSWTPAEIMHHRAIVPLSTSQYDPQTQFLDILINDVLKTHETDYTVSFVTYADNSSNMRLLFPGKILRAGDVVRADVYVWTTVPDYLTYDDTKRAVEMPDETVHATFTPPDWYSDSDPSIVAKMYDTGGEITADCTMTLSGGLLVVSYSGNASYIRLTLTKPNGSHQEKSVQVSKSVTVALPTSIFFTHADSTGKAVRCYYVGGEKLTGWTMQTVSVTGDETETLDFVQLSGTLKESVKRLLFGSVSGTDISNYTDLQLDEGRKLVDNLRLSNSSTGETLAFPGVKFQPGDVVELSTVSGEIYVRYADGTNLLGAVSGDFPKLQPGKNVISVHADTNQDLVSGNLTAKQLFLGV